MGDAPPKSNDRGISARSYYGTTFENTYAGVRSFMRRSYVPDLDALVGVDIAVLGVPFDLGTTNRPGARFGPEGIRRASSLISFGCPLHLEVDPFDQLAVVDCGDCDLPLNDLGGALDAIEASATRILASQARLLALGGDHLVSLPLLRAHAARHGPLALIHFDAHIDTLKDTRFDHGTVFHHAAQEGLIDPKRSVQVGIRSVNRRDDIVYNRSLGFRLINAESVHLRGVPWVVQTIRETVGGGPAYLSFDIDCLDPSAAPGTGTPEVGGLFSWQARAVLQRLQGLSIVAMDLVEVAPDHDHAQITCLAAANLAFDFIGLFASPDRF